MIRRYGLSLHPREAFVQLAHDLVTGDEQPGLGLGFAFRQRGQ
jgi:hypothetical protein